MSLPQHPTHIGRYHILSTAGRGGLATVYLATDPQLNQRKVALKCFAAPADPALDLARVFANEIKAVSALDHACIVPIYDAGVWEQHPFLVMKWMGGDTLAQRLRQNGSLAWADALQVFDRVALALQHAHSKGIIHRDLKPENVLFDESGSAFLADFGIARFNDNRSDLLPNTVGTMRYTPAEVWHGEKAQATADVYGLACVLGEMLLARPLFDGANEFEVLQQHRSKGPHLPTAWRDDVPTGLTRVLQRALAPNPAYRFTTITDLAKAIAGLLGQNQPALQAALYVPSGSNAAAKPVDTASQPAAVRPSQPATVRPSQPVSPNQSIATPAGQSAAKPSNQSIARPASGKQPSRVQPIPRPVLPSPTPAAAKRERSPWLMALPLSLGLCALLAAAVWLAGGGLLGLQATPTIAYGQAQVLESSAGVTYAAQPLAAGQTLAFAPSDKLQSKGAAARYRLALPAGAELLGQGDSQLGLVAADANQARITLYSGLLLVRANQQTTKGSHVLLDTLRHTLDYRQQDEATSFCVFANVATQQVLLQCLVGACPLPSGNTFTAAEGVKVLSNTVLPAQNPLSAIPGCLALAGQQPSVTAAPTDNNFFNDTPVGQATSTLRATVLPPTITSTRVPVTVVVTKPAAANTLAPVVATALPVLVTAIPQPVVQPPTAVPTVVAPTAALPPTAVPTGIAPTAAQPPTAVPTVTPTAVQLPIPISPTAAPVLACNPGQWGNGCGDRGCPSGSVSKCSDTGTWVCVPDPAACSVKPTAAAPISAPPVTPTSLPE